MLDGVLAHQRTVNTFDLLVCLALLCLGDDANDDDDDNYALSRRECGRGRWGVGFVKNLVTPLRCDDDDVLDVLKPSYIIILGVTS